MSPGERGKPAIFRLEIGGNFGKVFMDLTVFLHEEGCHFQNSSVEATLFSEQPAKELGYERADLSFFTGPRDQFLKALPIKTGLRQMKGRLGLQRRRFDDLL